MLRWCDTRVRFGVNKKVLAKVFGYFRVDDSFSYILFAWIPTEISKGWSHPDLKFEPKIVSRLVVLPFLLVSRCIDTIISEKAVRWARPT